MLLKQWVILCKKLVITLNHIAFYYYKADQWTPLHIATEYGNDSLVESLIKCGADVNAVEIVSYYELFCVKS